MIHIDFTLTYLQAYLVAINSISFILYAYDKLLALSNSKNISRVSENRLLLSTLIGGSIGSLLSMIIFRHKIKKASFMIKFSIVVIVQITIVFLYIKGIIPSGL